MASPERHFSRLLRLRRLSACPLSPSRLSRLFFGPRKLQRRAFEEPAPSLLPGSLLSPLPIVSSSSAGRWTVSTLSLMRDPSRRRIYGRSWFARRCYMLYIYVLPGFNGVACTVCHPTRTASQQYHVCHMFFFKIARSPVLYCTVLAYHRFSVSNTPGTIPKLRRSVLGSCNSPQYFLLLG